jgi:hypothetical protein
LAEDALSGRAQAGFGESALVPLQEASSQLFPILFIALALEVGLVHVGRFQPGPTAAVIFGFGLVAGVGESIALAALAGGHIPRGAAVIHDICLTALGLALLTATAALPIELSRAPVDAQSEQGRAARSREWRDQRMQLLFAFIVAAGLGIGVWLAARVS